MTVPNLAPPVPIQQMPGADDRFQQAIEPFLAAMKERREREQRQQQIMAQIGQLTLQQEMFAAEQKEGNERKKGLLQMGEALKKQLGELQRPGPIEEEISGAMQSGDPRLMEAIQKKVQVAGEQERLDAVFARYQQLAEKQGGRLTPEQAAARYDDMASAAPSNPNQGAWTNAANGLRGGLRQQQGKWIPSQPARQPDGSWRKVYVNNVTGEERVGRGEVATPFTAMTEKYGTAGHGRYIVSANQMRSAMKSMEAIEKAPDWPAIHDEVANFLVKLEAVGGARWPIAGTAPEVALRQFGLQDLSPDAQEYVVANFNWTGAKNFGDGGATLTAMEVAQATRGFAPSPGEDPQAIAEKIRQRNDVVLTKENLVPTDALARSRRGTSIESFGHGGARQEEKKEDNETAAQRRQRLRRAQGLGR